MSHLEVGKPCFSLDLSCGNGSSVPLPSCSGDPLSAWCSMLCPSVWRGMLCPSVCVAWHAVLLCLRGVAFCAPLPSCISCSLCIGLNEAFRVFVQTLRYKVMNRPDIGRHPERMTDHADVRMSKGGPHRPRLTHQM